MSKTLGNSDNLINSYDRPGSKRKDVNLSAPSGIGDNGSELMTESEVVQSLRIPEVSNSKDYHNVIEHLKKFRGLPRIHICRRALFPKKAILEWVEKGGNMEQLVKLNKRPRRSGRKFTYALRYKDENGKRKCESPGHTNLRKAEQQRAQKEKELQMGYFEPGSMRLKDFMKDSLAKTGDQIRESTRIDYR